jgi:hypothetical protein
MPYNLLLLPLLGGYIFARKCYRTRYSALRSENHKLILLAAEFGLYLLIVAAGLRYLFELIAGVSPFFASVGHVWHGIFPFDYSGTTILAFFLGLTAWKPINLMLRSTEEGEVDKAIRDKKDPLEVLLKDAMRDSRAVLVTLESGKVYVGQIIANFNPAYDVQTVKISPILSGYRSIEDQTVTFNIDYSDLLTKVHNNDPSVSPRDIDDLGIVIPLREIISACIFSLPMYKNFFARHNRH